MASRASELSRGEKALTVPESRIRSLLELRNFAERVLSGQPEVTISHDSELVRQVATHLRRVFEPTSVEHVCDVNGMLDRRLFEGYLNSLEPHIPPDPVSHRSVTDKEVVFTFTEGPETSTLEILSQPGKRGQRKREVITTDHALVFFKPRTHRVELTDADGLKKVWTEYVKPVGTAAPGGCPTHWLNEGDGAQSLQIATFPDRREIVLCDASGNPIRTAQIQKAHPLMPRGTGKAVIFSADGRCEKWPEKVRDHLQSGLPL